MFFMFYVNILNDDVLRSTVTTRLTTANGMKNMLANLIR